MNYRFLHRARVNASVEVAWSVFTEHEKFAEWTSIDWSITNAGSPERNGLGCIRQERGGSLTVVNSEEIVNYWVPHQLYGYHIISSQTYDSHQAIVRFFPKGPSNCEWVYDAQFGLSADVLEKQPNMFEYINKSTTYFMHDAECECERRASDITVPAFPLPVENAARKQS